MLKNTLR